MKKLKRILMSIVAIAFPWIIVLLDDNPGGALVALLMQATAIGWIPASVWAWRIVHRPEPHKSHEPHKTSNEKMPTSHKD